MWILENWQMNGSSPVLVKRAFKKAFKLDTHQLPKRDNAFKKEYEKMKRNKSAGHLVPGPKVRPDRFKLVKECPSKINLDLTALIEINIMGNSKPNETKITHSQYTICIDDVNF